MVEATATAETRRTQARARALMSAIWLAGSLVLAVLLLVGGDSSPAGTAARMLGVLLIVGLLVAFALLAVNASLGRDPERADARGAADLLTLTTTALAVATVVLVPLMGRPVGAGVILLTALGVLLLAGLLGIALWTRRAARPRLSA